MRKKLHSRNASSSPCSCRCRRGRGRRVPIARRRFAGRCLRVDGRGAVRTRPAAGACTIKRPVWTGTLVCSQRCARLIFCQLDLRGDAAAVSASYSACGWSWSPMRHRRPVPRAQLRRPMRRSLAAQHAANAMVTPTATGRPRTTRRRWQRPMRPRSAVISPTALSLTSV